jgi:hypothetical protein
VNMILMIKPQSMRKLSYILIKFPMKNITQISISPHCQVVIWIFKEPLGLNFLHISVSDNCQVWFFENFPESWVWTLVFFFVNNHPIMVQFFDHPSPLHQNCLALGLLFWVSPHPKSLPYTSRYIFPQISGLIHHKTWGEHHNEMTKDTILPWRILYKFYYL